MEQLKRIDKDKTLRNIIRRVNSTLGCSIPDMDDFLAKAETEKDFIKEAAEFVQAEIAYI